MSCAPQQFVFPVTPYSETLPWEFGFSLSRHRSSLVLRDVRQFLNVKSQHPAAIHPARLGAENWLEQELRKYGSTPCIQDPRFRELSSTLFCLRAHFAPIMRLSDDTLSTIFQLAATRLTLAPKPFSLSPQLTVARVCARWRSVSFDTASLWTKISFPMETCLLQTPVGDWLHARTKNAMLDLELQGMPCDPIKWHRDNLTTELLPRLSRLTVTDCCRRFVWQLPGTLDGSKLVNLEYFAMRGASWCRCVVPREESSLQLHIASTKMHTLRLLTNRPSMVYLLHYSTLVSLAICTQSHNVAALFPTYTFSLLDLLDQCRGLQDLVVSGVGFAEATHPVAVLRQRPPVVLSHLVRCTLQTRALEWLAAVKIPRLMTLSINQGLKAGTEPLTPILVTMEPLLNLIELDLTLLYPDDEQVFLQLVPNLKKLTVLFRGPTAYVLSRTTNNTFILVPNLSDLRFILSPQELVTLSSGSAIVSREGSLPLFDVLTGRMARYIPRSHLDAIQQGSSCGLARPFAQGELKRLAAVAASRMNAPGTLLTLAVHSCFWQPLPQETGDRFLDSLIEEGKMNIICDGWMPIEWELL